MVPGPLSAATTLGQLWAWAGGTHMPGPGLQCRAERGHCRGAIPVLSQEGSCTHGAACASSLPQHRPWRAGQAKAPRHIGLLCTFLQGRERVPEGLHPWTQGLPSPSDRTPPCVQALFPLRCSRVTGASCHQAGGDGDQGTAAQDWGGGCDGEISQKHPLGSAGLCSASSPFSEEFCLLT